MNDDEMLATMRRSLTGLAESLTDVRMEQPVTTIQGRARGRRRRNGLIGAGTGGLALGLGLALALGGGSPASGRSPASGVSATGIRPVHVNLVAWSVNTSASGKVYVDIRELQNPALLRRTLADAGVPAIVTFDEICTSAGGRDGGQYLHQILGKASVGGEARLVISPAGIPHGSELSIGILPVHKQGFRGLTAAFSLVPTGAKLTCGLPNPNPGPSGGTTKTPASSAGSGTAKTGF
jgi:hypothetical protein